LFAALRRSLRSLRLYLENLPALKVRIRSMLTEEVGKGLLENRQRAVVEKQPEA